MNKSRISIVFVYLAMLAASPAAPAAQSADKPALGGWGFDLGAIDTSVKPGDDFFRFVNGNWIRNNAVPDDRPRWGAFDELAVKAETDLKAIIDELLANPPTPGSDAARVADLYKAYLDTAAIEAAQLRPLAEQLQQIAALATHEAVGRFMARPDLPVGGPVGFFPAVDTKEPTRYVVQVTQSGLGLPDRDFYLDPAASFAAIRTKYRNYIAQLLTLANYPQAAHRADEILLLETRIAKLSWPYEKLRDYDATYHPRSRAQLVSMLNGFPIAAMLTDSGIPAAFDRFIVSEDTAVPKLAALLKDTPLQVWRAYLSYHCLDAFADVLPKSFDVAAFEFRGKVLNGQPQQRARWKRGIGAVNSEIGDALGTLYVARHFNPEAKAKMIALTDNLLAAYKVRINALEWMSPQTREAALRKLASFRVMVGYPEHWKSYQGLEIRADDPVGNRRRALAFEWRREVNRLDRPVDRSEWGLLAQEVNAENLGPFNAVIFPAAILQPPFFDPAADPAINYGAIGGVIGHEVSHSFDDQGAKLDEQGRLRQWWLPQDVERFNALGKRIVAQYDAFEALPGVHIRGANTIGENIADLGGLSAAHEAYRISLHGAQAPVLDGYTGEQRLFLGWGQAWRENIREAALRTRIVSDEHSPAEFRVNGVVRNVDAWYDAFGIAPTNKFYLAPGERVRIW